MVMGARLGENPLTNKLLMRSSQLRGIQLSSILQESDLRSIPPKYTNTLVVAGSATLILHTA